MFIVSDVSQKVMKMFFLGFIFLKEIKPIVMQRNCLRGGVVW